MNAHERDALDLLDMLLDAVVLSDDNTGLAASAQVPPVPPDVRERVVDALDTGTRKAHLAQLEAVVNLASEVDDETVIGPGMAPPADLRQHVVASMNRATAAVNLFTDMPQPPTVFVGAGITISRGNGHAAQLLAAVSDVLTVAGAAVVSSPAPVVDETVQAAQLAIAAKLIASDAVILFTALDSHGLGVASAITERMALPVLMLDEQPDITGAARRASEWLVAHRSDIERCRVTRRLRSERAGALFTELRSHLSTGDLGGRPGQPNDRSKRWLLLSSPEALLLAQSDDIVDVLYECSASRSQADSRLPAAALKSLAEAVEQHRWSVNEVVELTTLLFVHSHRLKTSASRFVPTRTNDWVRLHATLKQEEAFFHPDNVHPTRPDAQLSAEPPAAGVSVTWDSPTDSVDGLMNLFKRLDIGLHDAEDD